MLKSKNKEIHWKADVNRIIKQITKPIQSLFLQSQSRTPCKKTLLESIRWLAFGGFERAEDNKTLPPVMLVTADVHCQDRGAASRIIEE